MRVTLLAVASSLIFSVLPVSAQAVMRHYQLNIPRQPLDTALKDFAHQTGLQVARFSDRIDGSSIVGPVNGDLSADDALKSLLGPKGLSYKMVNERTIVVVKPGAEKGTAATTESSEGNKGTDEEGAQTTSKDRLQLAKVDQRASSEPSSVDSNSSAPQPGLNRTDIEEIVVTAQKREERIQDVPMSLSALSGEQLAGSQDFRFEDYVGKVPGLTLVDYGAWGSQLVVRGITTGANTINSGVASYVDETPYTMSGAFARSMVAAPNLDTFDMQRIEVLRGPQGTLYGANALAGLLKYVTNPPDPSQFSVKLEAGGNSVSSGSAGFDIHGMVNMPLSPIAALRVVGYDTYYPGFIDDPGRQLTDINGSHYTGGRASVLFSPVSELSIRLNASYQRRSYGDWPTVDVNPGTLSPIDGALSHTGLISQPGYTTNGLYNATANWDAGFATLLSSTSYVDFRPYTVQDQSKTLGVYVTAAFAQPYGEATIQSSPGHAIVQEIRLSSAGSSPFQWLAGGFFTNESSNLLVTLLPVSVSNRTILNPDPLNLGSIGEPFRYREYATFANLDYHLTEALDVGVGGRYSRNSQNYHDISSGVFLGANNFETQSSEGVFTYSTDIRWRPTSNSMFYGRIASGYAPGGPNDVVPTITSLPRSYSSTKTTNFEVGAKGSALGGRLTADISVFHIDWRDLQLVVTEGGLSEITSGGKARSDGVEWSTQYIPITGLSLNINGSYTDAHLTEDNPVSVGGHAGDRLPSSPLWQGSAGARYERPLVGQSLGYLGVDWRFLGKRFAEFEAASPRQSMPSFNIVDLRAGVQTGRYELTIYAKNVGNKIGINYLFDASNSAGAGPQSAIVEAPRTIGGTVTVKF